MVSTVEFGEGGVITNFGIPKMSRKEIRAFQKAVATLVARQNLVKQYINEKLAGAKDDDI